MTQEILALCRTMGAQEDQLELLIPLARAVSAHLSRQLKPGIAPHDCEGVFPMAAALLTMDRLAAIAGSAGEITSFSAGDLTIHQAPAQMSRSAQAAELLAPWLSDSSFCFQEVDG